MQKVIKAQTIGLPISYWLQNLIKMAFSMMSAYVNCTLDTRVHFCVSEV